MVTVKLPPRLFHQEIVTAASSKERVMVRQMRLSTKIRSNSGASTFGSDCESLLMSPEDFVALRCVDRRTV